MKIAEKYAIVTVVLATVTFCLSATASAQGRKSAEWFRQNPQRLEISLGNSWMPIRRDGDVWFFEDLRDDLRIKDLYQDYDGDVFSTGTVMLDCSYIFRRWLTLTMGFGFNSYWTDVHDARTGEKKGDETAIVTYFMPEFKFTYFARPKVKLYSSIAMGASVSNGQMDIARSAFEMEIVPFGISVGRRFFGFAEIGYGTLFFGDRAGLGYRF